MNILFILNPKSGKKPLDQDYLASCIQLNFPGAEMRLTKGPGHATELAKQAAEKGFNAVIAIGGDGTINETAQGLVNTSTALGVIPHGSGNGFAREIGMSMDLEEALVSLQRAQPIPSDVGTANGELFLNLAGVGIEADIAWKFMEHGKTGKRGPWPYFKIGLKTVLSYIPQKFIMQTEGKESAISPLTLVFANGRQYGNNFKIAPAASLNDGKLDMVTVLNAPKWKLALATPSFFTSNWRPFDITNTIQVKELTLKKDGEFCYHIDGEPRKAKDSLTIKVHPKSLLLLTPKKSH